jgi:CDP-glycerol glycerophosphotransferase (TagB/SpsB family)/MFS family permease
LLGGTVLLYSAPVFGRRRSRNLLAVCVVAAAIAVSLVMGMAPGLIAPTDGAPTRDAQLAMASFAVVGLVGVPSGAIGARLVGRKRTVSSGLALTAVSGFGFVLMATSAEAIVLWRSLGGLGGGLAFAAGASAARAISRPTRRTGRIRRVARRDVDRGWAARLYGGVFLLTASAAIIALSLRLGSTPAGSDGWQDDLTPWAIAVAAGWLGWVLVGPRDRHAPDLIGTATVLIDAIRRSIRLSDWLARNAGSLTNIIVLWLLAYAAAVLNAPLILGMTGAAAVIWAVAGSRGGAGRPFGGVGRPSIPRRAYGRVRRIYRGVRRRFFIRARIWSVRLSYMVARMLPVRRRVVLATAHIPAIRGNLAAIAAEIQRRDPTIPIVSLIHDPKPGTRGRLRGIRQGISAGYHLATAAAFIVDSHYLPLYVIRRRPGTTVVQVWHACGAIKKIGYSVIGKSFGVDETMARMVRLHTNYDICLAGSQVAVEQYMDAFRQPAELFVTRLGIPRTDVLIDGPHQGRLIESIRQRYAIPADKRVILYAPTFRGTSMTKARHPEDLDLDVMARVLGDGHVLLMRLHPAIRSQIQLSPELADFTIDVSDYPEMNELMLVSDVLVTDYSSVIFEFALLGRPMAFFAPDTAAYDDERGFYFDYRSGVPGPVFEDSAELAAYLAAGEFDLDRVQRFAETWFDVADGHASERFYDEVIVPALDGTAVVMA